MYADSPKIKIKIAPIEVFVEMSAGKITDRETLFAVLKDKIHTWKSTNNFTQPINLTLTPMDWKFEVGI